MVHNVLKSDATHFDYFFTFFFFLLFRNIASIFLEQFPDFFGTIFSRFFFSFFFLCNYLNFFPLLGRGEWQVAAKFTHPQRRSPLSVLIVLMSFDMYGLLICCWIVCLCILSNFWFLSIFFFLSFGWF